MWTYAEFANLTGVNRQTVPRLCGKIDKEKYISDKGKTWLYKEETNEQGIGVVRKNQLFKIAIYLYLMHFQKNEYGKPLSTKYLINKYIDFMDEDEMWILNYLIDNLKEKKDILNKIRRAHIEKDTDYMLNIIKFLNGKIKKLPFSHETEKFNGNYKKLFFDKVDLLEISNEFRRLNIGYRQAISEKNNDFLLNFLDSYYGQVLNYFTKTFYEFIDIIKKYPNIHTHYVENEIYENKQKNIEIKKVPGIGEIYYKSIEVKRSFKDALFIPYLGYADHWDGYFLTHKIVLLRNRLPNYKNARSDLEKVLKKGEIDINLLDKNGNTVIGIAAEERDFESLKILKKYGASPFVDKTFISAIYTREPDLIRTIVDMVPDAKYSAFLKYVYEGEIDTVKALLDYQFENMEKYFLAEDCYYQVAESSLAVINNDGNMLKLLVKKINNKMYDTYVYDMILYLREEELAILMLDRIDPFDTYKASAIDQSSFMISIFTNNMKKLLGEIIKKIDIKNQENIDFLFYTLAVWGKDDDEMWDIVTSNIEEVNITKHYYPDSALQVLTNRGMFHRLEQVLSKIKDDHQKKKVEEIVHKFKKLQENQVFKI
ncbi:MAG: hypothetical protein KAX49_12705 [Halanaerobiales bacterium]|nr:hypothetical protein [Halanaerobiales bacterium]